MVQESVESEVTKEIFEEPNVSNNSNDLNNTNMTVNTNDVSVIIIVDSPHKNILSISERLRNIRAEHHFKYLNNKRNKNAIPEKPLKETPISVTPVTQEDNLPSNDTPNKWPGGTICIASDCILNGVDESLFSQKRLVKTRQFPGATITHMYDHLKPETIQNVLFFTFSPRAGA